MQDGKTVIDRQAVAEALEASAPEGALAILAALEEDGHEAVLVGGCVRDAALGREPHDYDVATSAEVYGIEETALRIGARIVPTGIAHGTVTLVMPDGQGSYEVSEYKSDISGDCIPRMFTPSLEGDLRKRDFTMNAMAWSPANGVIDMHGGLEDLASGVIRATGSPDARFREDPLRILRAMRLAAKYGMAIEPGTAEAMDRRCGLIARDTAPERVLMELRQLLAVEDGDAVAGMLSGHREPVFAVIPELRRCDGFPQTSRYHRLDVYSHIVEVVRACPPDEVTRFAALLHDVGKPDTETHSSDGHQHFYGHPAVSAEIAAGVMRRLRAPSAFAEDVVTLVRHHDDRIRPTRRSIRRAISRLGGREMFDRFLDLSVADVLAHSDAAIESPVRGMATLEEVRALAEEMRQEDDVVTVRDLEIGGDDLMGMGWEQGPGLGQELRRLLGKVLDGDCPNEKGALEALARADMGGDGEDGR